MVLKEARGVLDQLRMKLQKLLIQKRFVSGIVRGSILEKQIKCIQL